MRERPHRLDRSCYLGERTAAFTACIAERRKVLVCPAVVEPLVSYLRQVAEVNQCFVPVYCFMPNHLHVMFKGLGAESNLYAAMTSFKHRSAHWMARQKLPFRWQKDFYDHLIRGQEDWRSQATYIALNPVRAGLVENLFDHPFTGSIGTKLDEVILGWGR